jgi:hypothetical protein
LLLDPSSAHEGDNMIQTTPVQNKALVLEAFIQVLRQVRLFW